MKEYVFRVRGMSCSMCESHVNDAVRGIPGVKSVRSDRKKERMTVLAESLDPAAAEKAVSAAGYDACFLSEAAYEKPSLFGWLKR